MLVKMFGDLIFSFVFPRIVFEKKSKQLIGKIVHNSGRELVLVSSTEPAVSANLNG